MGSDMAAKLLDANGKLKPFRQWLDDVSSISTHHCGAWLRTEYDTAVIRAHNAADWQSFLRNKDVMPNLRWMPTTSPNPESSHRTFWEKKLTPPVDDPFWSKHHPRRPMELQVLPRTDRRSRQPTRRPRRRRPSTAWARKQSRKGRPHFQ